MLLTRGANTEIATTKLRIVVSWKSASGVDADVSAILIGPSGKVRHDADFIFYNQPRTSNQSVSHEGKSTSSGLTRDVLDVDLRRLDADVERVIVAASSDSVSFDRFSRLGVLVGDHASSRPLVEFPAVDLSGETAMVFVEIYRRQGAWKIRAVGQGYTSGLYGLATDFGIDVEEPEPALPPPPRSTADWYPAPGEVQRMRWWTGNEWSDELYDIPRPGPFCQRCGVTLKKRLFSRSDTACSACEQHTSRFTSAWRQRAERVLVTSGPVGAPWEELWTSLRKERIDVSTGRSLLRSPALKCMEKYVAFAFADGEIEEGELAGFNEAVVSLQLEGESPVREMRRRMERGRHLTRVRAGDLPRLPVGNLLLDSDEILYADEKVTYVRVLASGPKLVEGRLVATNKKLRFSSYGPGSWELAWSKVMSVESEYGRLILSATVSRGSGEYLVADGDLLAAVLVGVLRISKRLVLAPGERDTRSIPQHMRTTVWQRDGGACVQCRSTAYLEFDHVIPHSKGGATSVNNLQILCRRCNSDKSSRI